MSELLHSFEVSLTNKWIFAKIVFACGTNECGYRTLGVIMYDYNCDSTDGVPQDFYR